MLILSLLLFICVLSSWFFSGSEIGFISWNPLKVAHAAGQGNFTARLAMRLMNKRGQVLAVILVGNNVTNIVVALIFIMLFKEICAAVPDTLAFYLTRIPSPESLFLTPVLIVFGEILPKSLYRTYPFRLTMKHVPILTALYYLMSPLLWIFGAASKLMGGGPSAEARNAAVREEIVLVAVEGARRGTIFESADRVMKNTLGMKGRRIGEITAGLDEWKSGSAAYGKSQMLSEFRAGAETDEVIVFDDATGQPAGYVSLLDAAAHRGNELKTFGMLMKPLPRIRNRMEILACMRRMPPNSPRYYLVMDGDEVVVGILDKMAMYEAAFAEVGEI